MHNGVKRDDVPMCENGVKTVNEFSIGFVNSLVCKKPDRKGRQVRSASGKGKLAMFDCVNKRLVKRGVPFRLVS